MRGLPSRPVLPEPFPPGFRALLREILSRGPRLPGERVERPSRRHTALGNSGTFAGHRPYVRGDDLRRIDWAAYARSSELFVMQLEEEERRAATVLLDLSPRLCVGEPPRRLAALRLAAVIGGLALRHLDGLTVLAPGAGRAAISTFTGAAELDRLLQHFVDLPFVAVAPRDAVGLLLSRGIGGRVHWISDFADPVACESALVLLRRRGGRATGWLPALPEDREPPRLGYMRVVDPESGEWLTLSVDRTLRDAMRRQLEVLRRSQDRVFAQCGHVLARWSAPAADDFGWPSYEEVVRRCQS